MHLEANSSTQGITILWIPDSFGEPIIAGNNVVSNTVTKVDGGYKANVTVKGNYSVEVDF